MSEWEKMKLGDMVTFNPKLSLPKGSLAKKVAMEHLSPFTKYVTKFELSSYTGGAKFMNGDILLARITPCLENGKTSQVTLLNEGEIGFGSTEFIVLRAKDGIADKDFIYYLAISPQFRDYAIKSMVGSSGRQRVQQDVLENMYIDCPSISEQETIAAVLSALDDKIELNNRINKNLEAQAQAIFKNWFVDFEPFRDGEFVDSELGLIPKGWEIRTLKMCCDMIARGITPKYTDVSDQTVINQKCIRDHQVNLEPARCHIPKVQNEKWLKFGDVLVNSTGQGTLGRVAQWYGHNINITVDSHVTIVRTNDYKLMHYLGQLMISRESEIESMASGSTGQTELSRERLGSMSILLPDQDSLDLFSKIVEPMMMKITANNRQSKQLAILRDALLPKLICGEIEVPIHA